MAHKKFEAQFEIEQRAEVLFPLFSAEGEKLWVPGWNYIDVSGSKELYEDYIFMTSNHDFATTNAIWLVKRYDPEHLYVQFYKVEPEDKVAVVSVQCEPISITRTRVTVGYDYTSLSQKGEDFIHDHGQTDYEAFIGEWKLLLERYFDSVE